MSAELKDFKAKKQSNNGFEQITLTEIYQLNTNRTTGPVSTFAILGLPQIDETKLFEGTRLWCNSVEFGMPNAEDAATHRIAIATWTNNTQLFARDSSGNQVSEPTGKTDRVVFDTVSYTEPITDAEILAFTIGVPWGHPNGGAGATILSPTYLPIGRVGAITNSAAKPVFKERQRNTEQITVWRTSRNWNNSWDDLEDSINSDSVTITQTDSDGTRLSKTYAPFTLKLEKVHKVDEWRDSKLYFNVGFQMVYNKRTWIHAEADRGTERRVYVGQSKPEGGTYAQSDLDDLEIDGAFGLAAIMTDNKTVAISEPIKLNGHGAEMPLDRSDSVTYDDDKEVWINYYLNDRVAFNTFLNPS